MLCPLFGLALAPGAVCFSVMLLLLSDSRLSGLSVSLLLPLCLLPPSFSVMLSQFLSDSFFLPSSPFYGTSSHLSPLLSRCLSLVPGYLCTQAFTLRHHEPTKAPTHQPTNPPPHRSPTHQPTNPSTHQLTNSLTDGSPLSPTRSLKLRTGLAANSLPDVRCADLHLSALYCSP